jgi:hypothetical protein
VTQALDNAEPSLEATVHAFVAALSATLDDNGRVIPALLANGRGTENPERRLRAVTTLHRRFVDAVMPYHQRIRHPDPAIALNTVFRSVIAAGAHRAAILPLWPDNLTWQQWAREIADMATAYLMAERNSSAAT